MRGQALFAASAFALMAMAQPAAAQQYQYPSYHDEHVAVQQQCQQSRQNRMIGGAIIGGLAGALLGREVADRGVRGEGAALGAVVGAAAGAGVGRSTAQCNQVQGSYDPYYGQPYGGNQPYGEPYRQGGYSPSGYARDCETREIRHQDRYGRTYSEDVYMCRGNDGVWRPAD